jgi:signal transduction histidine kinase
LTDRDDKLKALEVGADEFIRKPPDRQELLIRIKSLLRTKKLYMQVQSSREGLREIEQAKHDLTHMIVHDMRGPLSSIISSLNLLLDEAPPPAREMQEKLLKNSLLTGRRIMTMLEAMLDVQRIEAGQMPV